MSEVDESRFPIYLHKRYSSTLRYTILPELPAPFQSPRRFTRVNIEPQSVLACFTHWVLPYQMIGIDSSGLHRLYTIRILFICHGLLGKSGFTFSKKWFTKYLKSQKANLNR